MQASDPLASHSPHGAYKPPEPSQQLSWLLNRVSTNVNLTTLQATPSNKKQYLSIRNCNDGGSQAHAQTSREVPTELPKEGSNQTA
jgi:hypothetical protein